MFFRFMNDCFFIKRSRRLPPRLSSKLSGGSGDHLTWIKALEKSILNGKSRIDVQENVRSVENILIGICEFCMPIILIIISYNNVYDNIYRKTARKLVSIDSLLNNFLYNFWKSSILMVISLFKLNLNIRMKSINL